MAKLFFLFLFAMYITNHGSLHVKSLLQGVKIDAFADVQRVRVGFCYCQQTVGMGQLFLYLCQFLLVELFTYLPPQGFLLLNMPVAACQKADGDKHEGDI